MQFAKLNVNQDYIGFVLLCLVVGSENSPHPLKVQQNAPQSSTCSTFPCILVGVRSR